jgi:hypothetical protein
VDISSAFAPNHAEGVSVCAKRNIVYGEGVPCCGGIENAVKCALMESGKFIPWRVITITTDGKIID